MFPDRLVNHVTVGWGDEERVCLDVGRCICNAMGSRSARFVETCWIRCRALAMHSVGFKSESFRAAL